MFDYFNLFVVFEDYIYKFNSSTEVVYNIEQFITRSFTLYDSCIVFEQRGPLLSKIGLSSTANEFAYYVNAVDNAKNNTGLLDVTQKVTFDLETKKMVQISIIGSTYTSRIEPNRIIELEVYIDLVECELYEYKKKSKSV